MNNCNVTYNRHGTELQFYKTVDAASPLGQCLIDAGFIRSAYTIRNAVTFEVESYIPYWYIGYSVDPGEIESLVGMSVSIPNFD